MTKTQLKFAGDEYAERIEADKVSLIVEALTAAKAVVYPMTVQQIDAALAGKDEDGYASKLVAALICAEADLDKIGDEEIVAQVQRALRATGRRLVERGGNRGWLTFDIFLVAEDETEYWTLPDEWKDHVERVEGVYFFDRNTHVHICSFTPNYDFRHLENRVIFKDGVEEKLGEREYGRLRDKAWEYVMYASGDSDGYRDVSDVESFLEKHAGERFRVFHYGNPGIDLDEALETAKDNAERDIRNTRRRNDYSTDTATIQKMVEDEFSDPAQADEGIQRVVFDEVREYLQANSHI